MKNNLVTSVIILVAVIVVGYLLISKGANAPSDELDNGAMGKIDINTVCEGALAYMTFPDGASAEMFVQECKEGKHPQVIEQYKAQMNLGGGENI